MSHEQDGLVWKARSVCAHKRTGFNDGPIVGGRSTQNDREHENLQALMESLTDESAGQNKAMPGGSTSASGGTSEEKLVNQIRKAQAMVQKLKNQGRFKEAKDLEKEMMLAADEEGYSSGEEKASKARSSKTSTPQSTSTQSWSARAGVREANTCEDASDESDYDSDAEVLDVE